MKNPPFEVVPLPAGWDRTRSPLVARLVTLADEDEKSGAERRSVIIDFEGDRDKAHMRTKSWRAVCGRLGYVLRHRVEPTQKKLVLWATKLE